MVAVVSQIGIWDLEFGSDSPVPIAIGTIGTIGRGGIFRKGPENDRNDRDHSITP